MRLPSKSLAAVLAALSLSAPGFAQDSTAPEVAAPAPPALEASAPAREASPDATRDFKAERLALAASKGYNAYAIGDKERSLVDAYYAIEQAADTTPEKRKAAIDDMLQQLPLSFFPHAIAARWYRERFESSSPPDQSLYDEGYRQHRIAQGIMDSIADSGDGASQDTAWVVIHVGEEYMLMEYLELQPKDQSLLFDSKGRAYDAFRVVDKEGKERQVFFDISAFFGKGFDLDP